MKKRFVTKTLYNIGMWRALNVFWGAKRLTVLAYHRIIDGDVPEFDFFEQNISATPDMFARHMAFVEQHFNVVSLADLEAHVVDGKPLPTRPLLITFDDGYLDNYENARPILKRHGFPAVIFLMTDGMATQKRPWWDTCAYYFHHTRLPEAELPLLGHCTLNTDTERRAARNTLSRQLKTIPEEQKLEIIGQLSNLLEVPPPQDKQLFVNWDQVRELVADGIACQPHTVHHPILSRVGQDQQYAELRDSRDTIVRETQQAVVAFAYPNGTIADYNQYSLDALRELNYKLAFTLTEGPMPLSQVRQHPLEIQRVFIGKKDMFETFALKTMGLLRLFERPSYVEKGASHS